MTDTGALDPTQITGLILAGGLGRRAGGRDKGWIVWQGDPLVAHVARRLQPQCGEIVISCNRNRERYAAFGLTVADQLEGYQGPLAGLHAAAGLIHTPFTLVCPCDVPHIPTDMATTLFRALTKTGKPMAFARTSGREHYCCALLRTQCLDSLAQFLSSGGRAVREWHTQQGSIAVDFPEGEDNFRNVNTLN